MKARSQTADLLKGIAVLLMIQVHVLELFATGNISGSVYGKVLLFLGGPPVAPVFSAVLGYFIAASAKSPGQLAWRGIKIFLLGMVLNLALNLNLLLSVSKGLLEANVFHYIFGVDILQFAGLSILLLAALRSLLERSAWITLTLLLLSACLGKFLMDAFPVSGRLQYICAFFYASCDWSYFPLFPWFAYPLAGFAFYQLKQGAGFSLWGVPKMKWPIGLLFIVFLLLTLRYAVFVSADLASYYHHDLLFALWTIGFLAFYSFWIHELSLAGEKSAPLNWLKWLGEQVTMIYVVQWIIIGNVATAIYKTVSSPLTLLLWCASVLAASVFITWLLLLLRKRFSGKPL